MVDTFIDHLCQILCIISINNDNPLHIYEIIFQHFAATLSQRSAFTMTMVGQFIARQGPTTH